MDGTVVVLITAGSQEEAAGIAKALVDEHLVACVNILPGVRSFFFWEGATQDAAESLMVCKTSRQMMDRLVDRVRTLHSYSVPEIIALPVVAGLPAYLEWVSRSTQG